MTEKVADTGKCRNACLCVQNDVYKCILLHYNVAITDLSSVSHCYSTIGTKLNWSFRISYINWFEDSVIGISAKLPIVAKMGQTTLFIYSTVYYILC